MEPTIKPMESCYAYRFAYAFSEPKRGDLVMYMLQDFSDVSRIVAVPGDEVQIKAQELFVKSYDSRYDNHGLVNIDDIYGKVVLHFGWKSPFVKTVSVAQETSVMEETEVIE